MNGPLLVLMCALLSPVMERGDSALEIAVTSARADAVQAAVEVLAAEGTTSARLLPPFEDGSHLRREGGDVRFEKPRLTDEILVDI